MPPKRKAMAEISANKKSASSAHNAKASKTSAKDTASKKSAKTTGRIFKYCNPKAVRFLPFQSYVLPLFCS